MSDESKGMVEQQTEPFKILAVDDEEEILETYHNILGSNEFDNIFLEIDTKAGELFSDKVDGTPESPFEPRPAIVQ